MRSHRGQVAAVGEPCGQGRRGTFRTEQSTQCQQPLFEGEAFETCH